MTAAEKAACALLKMTFVHTVMIRLDSEWSDQSRRLCAGEAFKGGWRDHSEPSDLDLEGGMDGFMSRAGYRMRRNVRYYRRRAISDLGSNFHPVLSTADAVEAVKALSRATSFPISASRSLQYWAGLQAVPGSFAMGLKDDSGRWLSFIAGWRESNSTCVAWQMNRVEHRSASISTVMRSYFVEHEANQAVRRIKFIGGTNRTWARACGPQICRELLAMRHGWSALLAKGIGCFLRPNGLMSEVYRQNGQSSLKADVA